MCDQAICGIGGHAPPMAWSPAMSKSPSARNPGDAPRSGRARRPAISSARSAAWRSSASASSRARSSAAGARSSASATPRCPRRNRSAFPRAASRAGVLTLLVEGAHAPLMQHLAPLIIERVNRFFGYAAIDRLVFRQGTPAGAAGAAEAARAAAGAQGAGRGPARNRRPRTSRLPRIARRAN